MPYVIPEAMPQDWIVPALESLDIPVSDDRAADIEAAMRKTYADLIETLKVPKVNGTLRMACIAAAHRSVAS